MPQLETTPRKSRCFQRFWLAPSVSRLPWLKTAACNDAGGANHGSSAWAFHGSSPFFLLFLRHSRPSRLPVQKEWKTTSRVCGKSQPTIPSKAFSARFWPLVRFKERASRVGSVGSEPFLWSTGCGDLRFAFLLAGLSCVPELKENRDDGKHLRT